MPGKEEIKCQDQTKKGPFVHARLLKKIEEMNANGNKEVIKTWSRSSTIFPQW